MQAPGDMVLNAHDAARTAMVNIERGLWTEALGDLEAACLLMRSVLGVNL